MANVGETIGNTAAGATTGFTIGGPPGAIVGGTLGLIKSLFSSSKSKKDAMDKVQSLPTDTPEQRKLKNLIYQGLAHNKGPLKDIFGRFNEENFQKGVVEPNLKTFQENILPQITEKYLAGNRLPGSGYRRAATKAGTDFASNLAQLRYGAQQQQRENRLKGAQTALGGGGVENIVRGQEEPVWKGALKGAAETGGKVLIDKLLERFQDQPMGSISSAGKAVVG